MEEIFYEDILETFLFCFIASLGLIQIMVAKRRWHGLSLYGGRLRPTANYILGAALVVFAYAWYFSDPLHRNVRNIEAFMSMACLVLGIAAAGAATAIVASTAEALRRRFGRGGLHRQKGAGSLAQRHSLAEGTVLISRTWGEQGKNLVVVAEPGRGSENLVRSLLAALPRGHGLLSLHPGRTVDDMEAPYPAAAEEDLRRMFAWAEEERGMDLYGETFLGLGWGGNALGLLDLDLEGAYQPRRLLMVAPVVPDCERDFVGDALLSDTTLDVLAALAERKPWKDKEVLRTLRVWVPVLVVCIALASAVTVGFDVRWKLLSGPLTGLILSLWVTYFLVRWRGEGSGESRETKLVSRLSAPPPGDGGIRFTLVLTSGDPAVLQALPAQAMLASEAARLELWEDVLRGKFILDGGTPGRLASLIWGEEPGGEQ